MSSFVGIDVSKKTLDTALFPQATTSQVPNEEMEIKQLSEALVTLGPSLIVVEATGGLEQQLLIILTEKGCPYVW